MMKKNSHLLKKFFVIKKCNPCFLATFYLLCLTFFVDSDIVKAQAGCGRADDMGSAANVVSVTKCLPFAEVRIVYQNAETFTMLRGDVWSLDFGNGTTIDFTVVTDRTVPTPTNPNLVLGAYPQDPTNANPYEGLTYHSYRYTDDNNPPANCRYRVSIIARRDCPPVGSPAGDKSSPLTVSEVPIFALDRQANINNETRTKIYLCEGSSFDTKFQYIDGANCSDQTLRNTIGFNGDFSSALPADENETEHRRSNVTVIFSNFNALQNDGIKIEEEILTTNNNTDYSVISRRTDEKTPNNGWFGTGGGFYANTADFSQPRVKVPGTSTIYQPGQGVLSFQYKFNISKNICIREYNRLSAERDAIGLPRLPNLPTNQKSIEYIIQRGPDPPTVASPTIYHCIGTPISLGVTATDPSYTLMFYERQGANPTTLNTISTPARAAVPPFGGAPGSPAIPALDKTFVVAGSLPVARGAYQPNPTAAGVYTYYVAQQATTNGTTCLGEVATIEVVVLPRLPQPTFSRTSVCVFGQLTLDANAPAGDVTVPVINTGVTPAPAPTNRTIQTEYVWTLPNNTYLPSAGTGITSGVGSNPTVADHMTRNQTAVFNVVPPSGPGANTNGSVNFRSAVLTRRYLGTSTGPTSPNVPCTSPSNAQTITETYVNASVDDDGAYCFGNQLNVRLSGYITNRRYNINFSDNFNNTYASNNVLLTGVNQRLALTPNAGFNIRPGQLHNIIITRMAILDNMGVEECVNNAAQATSNPRGGAVFPNTGGGARALPELLSAKVAGTVASPDATVCPGEAYTITLPVIPAAQLGTRTVSARVLGLGANFNTTITNNVITVTPKVRIGNLSATFTVRRELSASDAGPNANDDCTSIDNIYYINVRSMPFARIVVSNPNLTEVCFGNTADIVFNDFQGQNPTTSTYEIDVQTVDDANAVVGTQTFTMTPGASTNVTRQLPVALLREGGFVYARITEVRETAAGATICSFRYADTDPVINQTPKRYMMRTNLEFTGTVKPFELGSVKPTGVVGGVTIYEYCSLDPIVFRIVDASNNIIPPPANTEYVWNLPAGWTLGSTSASGGEVNVTPSPGTSQIVSVARRYISNPRCETTLKSNTVPISVDSQLAPFNLRPVPPVCGSGSTVVIGGRDLAPGERLIMLVNSSPPSTDPTRTSSHTFNTSGFFRNGTTGPISSDVSVTFHEEGNYALQVHLSNPALVTCGNTSIFLTVVVQPVMMSNIPYIADSAGPNQDICGVNNATGVANTVTLSGEVPQVANGHSASWVITNYEPQGLNNPAGTPNAGAQVVVVPTNNPATNLVLATFDDNTKNDAVLSLGTGQYGKYNLTYTIDSGCTRLASGAISKADTMVVDVKMPISIDDIDVQLGSASAGTSLGTIDRVADPNEVTLCIALAELNNGLDLSARINGPLTVGVGGGTWSTTNGGGAFTLPTSTDRTVLPVAPLTNANRAMPLARVTEFTSRYTPVVADYGKDIILQLQANPEAGYPCTNAVTKSIRVRILRSPTLVPQDIIVCNGDNFSLNFSSDITAGVTYNWDVSMVNQVNTALPYPFNASTTTAVISDSGNIGMTAITNNTTNAYQARLTARGVSGACSGPAAVYNVTFLPSFSLTTTLASSRCSSDAGAFVLAIPRAEYSTVSDPSGNRVPVNLEFSVEDYGNNAVKAANFVAPPAAQLTQTTIPGDIDARFNDATNANYGSPFTFSIPAAQLALTNTASDPQTISINIRTYVDYGKPAGTTQKCYGPSYTYVLTVSPTPIITPRLQSVLVCDGDELNLHSSVRTQLPAANVLYQWRITNRVPNNPNNVVNGAVDSATGVVSRTITQTLSITNTVAGNLAKSHVSLDYEVTPFYSGGVGLTSCEGATPVTFTVLVLPKPEVSPLTARTLCSGVTLKENLTTTNIGDAVVVPESNAWVEYSISIIGSASYTATPDVRSTIDDVHYILSSSATNTAPTLVPVEITPIYHADWGGPNDYTCNGNVVIHNVTLLPIVSITNPQNTAQICDNTSFQFIPTHNITSVSPPIDYRWSSDRANPADPLFTASNNAVGTTRGEGTMIDETIDFTGVLTTPLDVIYTITPRYQNGVVGGNPVYCEGTPFTFTVTVSPSPTITTNTVYNDACSGRLIFGHGNVNNSQPFSIDPAGANISWRVIDANPAGEVTGYSAAGNGVFDATVVNNTNTAKNIEIEFTPSLGVAPNLCTGGVINKRITIAPGPTTNNVNFNVSSCSLTKTVGIVGADPNNIDYQITPSATVTGMTYEFVGTITNATTGAVDATGVSVYNALGAAIPLTAGVGVAHFTHGTAGLSPLALVGGNISPFQLKVVNESNSDVVLNVTFNALLPGGCRGGTFVARFIIQPIPSVNNLPTMTVGASNTDYHFEICSGERFEYEPTSAIGSNNLRFRFSGRGNRPGSPSPVLGVFGVPDVVVDRDPATATLPDRISFIPTFATNAPGLNVQYYQLDMEIFFNNVGGANCSSVVQPIYLKLLPMPTVSLDATTTNFNAGDIIVCNGEEFEIFVTGTENNTTYDWTAASNANVGLQQTNFIADNYVKRGSSGLIVSATTVTSLLSARLAHNESTVQQVDYVITPSINKTSGGSCVGQSPLTVRVLIQPIARITNAPAAAVEVCSGRIYNFMPVSTVAGATYRWELINNGGSDVTIASSNTPALEHTIVNNMAAPAISDSGGVTITRTGVLNHVLRNTSGSRAVLRFRVIPVLPTSIAGKTCEGTPSEIVLNVEPDAVSATVGTSVFAVDHGGVFNHDPGITVAGVTYDWRAVIPAGVTIVDAGGATVTTQMGVQNLSFTSVSNTSNDVKVVKFSITPKIPGSACTGRLIRVDLHVLPNVVLTLTPSPSQTICSDESMNLLIQDNITATNASINHTYDWTATQIGPNVREITPAVAGGAARSERAVEAGALNVAKANIGDVGNKRLGITSPDVNIANETVTYTFTTRIVHSYTNAAGPQTIRSAEKSETVVYTVVPTPITSGFMIADVAGVLQPAGTSICRGQIVTYQFDVTQATPNGTLGNSYSVTATTAAGSAVVDAPIISVNGNRALVRYNNNNDWSGTLEVVETSAMNGCRGSAMRLAVTTISAPVANAGADITVCSGDMVTLGRDVAGADIIVATDTGGVAIPGAIYRWEPPFYLDNTQAGNGFDVEHPVVIPTQTTTYRLIVSIPNGCSSVEDTVTVTIAPTPSRAIISGPSGSLCENENYNHQVAGGLSTFNQQEVQLTASVDASTTSVTWYRTSTNTNRIPALADVITAPVAGVTFTASNAASPGVLDVLTITGSANNGFYHALAVGPPAGASRCNPPVSDPFRVNFITNPTRVTISVQQGASDDNFICSTGNEQITLTASGAFPSYRWYYFNPTLVGAGVANSVTSASIVAGANTSTLMLSRPLQSGFYATVPLDANGCEGPLSVYQEVIILRKLSTPWITTSNPNSVVCENGAITLTANLSELLATPPTVDAMDVEFIWMLDPDGNLNNGNERIVTNVNGTSALATSSPTPYTGSSIALTSATATNGGNYTLIARRSQNSVNAHTVNGNPRPANTRLYCPSETSRALLLAVVSLPPTPLVSIPSTSTNPFCGDKGATKSLILNATHPSSTTATPVVYPASVTFKWERKALPTDPDTSYVVVPGNEVGTNRLALTLSSESGVYRVTAEIRTGSSICANAPVVYPANGAAPNTVTIYDSPKKVSLTASKTILCFSDRLNNASGVLGNFIAVDESDNTIFGDFTVELEVSIPDPDNPTTGVRTSRRFVQTYTTNAATPTAGLNLNNPEGRTVAATPPATGIVPVEDIFQNNSSVNAIYRFTVLSVNDGNSCEPPSLPVPFEVTVLPSPRPTEIRTAVTSSGQAAATIDVTATGERRVVVCGDGTKIVRFEIDPVPGSSYAWGFFTEDFAKDATLSQNLTKPNFYEYIRGGSSSDTYLEVKFVGGSMTDNPIRARVTDGTTGCSTIKSLDVTIFGPVTAKAGDDYSICPENVRTHPTLSRSATLSVPKSFVQLGNNNNISVANITPGKQPGSGTYTYLWQKKLVSGLIPIPASEFRAGSSATDEKPFVSPDATSTYTVTVTDTGAGCSISEDDLVVYVFPKPTIVLSQTILGVCATQNGVATLGSRNAGATTGIASGTDGNAPQGSLSPVPVLTGEYEYICENCQDTTANPAVYLDGSDWKFDRDRTHTNPTNANKVGRYNVTVLYRDVRGCSESLVGSLIIEVYPLPVISMAPIAAVCLNTPAFKLTGMISGVAIPASVTPSATANPGALANNEYRMSGAGVTLDTTNNVFMFDASVAGVNAAHSITFEYRDNSGCVANPVITTIKVKELPNLSIATRGSAGTRFNFGICEGQGAGNRGYLLSEGRLTPAGSATPAALTGGDLVGVEYSGTGVSADTGNVGSYYFNPSVAGVGSHTLTFSYTDQNPTAGEISCKNSVDFRVEVWEAPTISFPDLADVSKCASLFNLTTATVTPDLSALPDVPNQPEGFYRDVIAITRGVTDGYDITSPAMPVPGNTALVIRQIDAANQTIAFQIDPRRSVSTVGTHLLRYDYRDGFGCENVIPSTAKLKIVPPPSPTLTPKDPKDTNPVVANRRPFSAICPNDSPFEITSWGSAPPTGGSGTYATADNRMARLITTRTSGGTLQYWFDPTELYNLSSSLVDLSRAFSINIRYTVTDASGCSGFDTQSILITPVPTGSISAGGDNCNGSPLVFTMNQQGYAPFTVEYYDISKASNPFTIQAGHLHRVNVEPRATTIYRIGKITDANGCVNYSPPRSQAIVSATPNASFKPDPVTQTIPNKTVTFINESNSDAWVFNWEFGDGTRIDGSKSDGVIDITHADGSTTRGSYVTPVHTYRRDGVYTVVLRATGGDCDATATNIVTIEARVPSVDFIADKLTGCAPLEVTFTNLSKFVDNDDYLWTFGVEDAGQSTSINPVYTFTKPGSYRITLVGSSAVGNPISEVKDKYITVFAQPDARFTIDPRTVYLPTQPIRTTNLSFGATKYEWDFGDGNTSEEVEPIHVYEKSGQYDIKLKAINALTGCTDEFTISNAVTALDEGTIEIPNVFTPDVTESSLDGSRTSIEKGYSPPDNSINNDVFLPIVTQVVKFEMHIFDSWGGMLFASKSQSIGWNGYYKGKLVPAGTYVYKILIEFTNGRRLERMGDVTVIR